MQDINNNAQLNYSIEAEYTTAKRYFNIDPDSGNITTADDIDRETYDIFE